MKARQRSRTAGDLLAVALASLLLAALGHAQPQWRWTDVSRVVVVGDVHGAYGALIEILQDAGLIGRDLDWTGGAAHLVSLGDLIDRGTETQPVLDLVMRLEREAAAAGGRVHVVLGNHELMNLLGDLRYVSPGDYASFAEEEDSATRAAAFSAFAATARAGDAAAVRAEFDAAYPPGFFARAAAFEPSGRYGAWLESLPTVLVIDDTAYVHGGLPPIVAELGLGLNAKVRADLTRYLELRDRLAAQGVLPRFDRRADPATARDALASARPDTAALLTELVALGDALELGIEGPHWYRGSVYCKPLLEEPKLDAALERLGARRAIVGHTPTADRRVRALYGGKLVMADTGMLVEYFRGRPAALVLERSALEVRHLHPAERASVVAAGLPVAHGLTDSELAGALALGTVTAVERDGAGRRRVVIDHDGTALTATFVPRGNGGAADSELAAAALDDLLGTSLVAPTVPRAIEGRDGALQLRYPDAIAEADRAARALAFSGWCPIEPQLGLMRVFDGLIGNGARTAANALFTNGRTDLTLIEHGGAFGTERVLPSRASRAAREMTPSLAAALRSLDEAGLRAALGAWLDARQIRAVLARRDGLLAASRD